MVLMQTAARIVKDVRHYWPLYLVALVGSMTMWLGALRIEEPTWVYAWIAAVGVAWAAAGVLLKRRIERRLATGAERAHP